MTQIATRGASVPPSLPARTSPEIFDIRSLIQWSLVALPGPDNFLGPLVPDHFPGNQQFIRTPSVDSAEICLFSALESWSLGPSSCTERIIVHNAQSHLVSSLARASGGARWPWDGVQPQVVVSSWPSIPGFVQNSSTMGWCSTAGRGVVVRIDLSFGEDLLVEESALELAPPQLLLDLAVNGTHQCDC